MDSLAMYQYSDIKTAVQATTQVGDFSLIWPQDIYDDVAYTLDVQDGFSIDENSHRVSWRDPEFPTRKLPVLLDSDRAFVASCVTVLTTINANARERISKDLYYAHISAKPNLPSAEIQFLHTFYVDRVVKEPSSQGDSSSYFVTWTKKFPVEDRYALYRSVVRLYKEMFIHL